MLSCILQCQLRHHVYAHCGRNTHSMQICFPVPNFNFKYYIWNLKNYVTTGIIFEEIMQKLASRENYASEEIKCTIFLLFFRRTCFSLPNFNFKYAYMKFEELCDNGHKFLRKNAKTGKQRKLCKWRDQMHHFFIILCDNINCHCIQATIN